MDKCPAEHFSNGLKIDGYLVRSFSWGGEMARYVHSIQGGIKKKKKSLK